MISMPSDASEVSNLPPNVAKNLQSSTLPYSPESNRQQSRNQVSFRASFGLIKDFDGIEFDSFFHDLSDLTVEPIICDSFAFLTLTGMKQGDAWSSNLFHAGLQHAFTSLGK